MPRGRLSKRTARVAIVGYGKLTNGSTRAFLLTPVPEPETYALMMGGLGVLGLVARRRRT